MSRRTIFSLLAVILAAALIGSSLWLLTNRSANISQLLVDLGVRRTTQAGPVVASGFIEAQEVSIAAEYAGRVITLTVDEGDTLAAGQPLLALDTTLLDARIEAAVAAVGVAEAQEDQITAGLRAETLRVAEAEVARAGAARDAAHQAWQDAILLRDNPQELQVEIAAAQARLQVAEHQLAQSEALRDAAAVGYEKFEEVMDQVGPAQRIEIASGPLAVLAPLLQQILPPDVYQAVISGGDGTYGSGDYEVVVAGGQATVYRKVGLQLDFHLLPNAYWQAGATVNVAQAARDGARATLTQLRAVAADPQAAQAHVDAAHSAYLAAQAHLEAARASLETLKAGATEAELALARTQVQQARADLSILETQRARTHLTAPRSGVVTRRYIAPGELAVPGAPLLALADLSDVTLTVYVPVDELGQVHLGQAVAVCVDSFPARTFQGTVVTIADEAEFTPSATQTEEERVNLVFAVRVRLVNNDGSLKPGMPADATFDTLPSSTCRGATTEADAGPIEVSGVIEGRELTLSSETGGSIAELRAAEGDRVRPGDVLMRLDDALLQAKLAQAQAQVETAQAARDLVAAGPRPGEIAAARAAVSAAEATRDGALEAWHNAIIARDDPQELDARITAVRAELEVATHQVEQARLALQAAELERNQTEADSVARRAHDAQVRAAAASLAAVEAARDGAQAQLYQLYAMQAQPLAAEAQMRAAADQYAIAAAELRLAQARLLELEAGPDGGEIAVADARVRQAQAAAAIVLAQQRLMTLTVPAEGAVSQGQISVVTAIVAHAGEIAAAGAPLMTLTRLDPLQLTLYIPTDQIGRVSLRQPVAVRVDSFPDETFRGQVVYISSRAEFTPHSLQTRNERVRAVFAIRVALPNVGARLKPGMPADAVLE